jgi:hypothetical protein
MLQGRRKIHINRENPRIQIRVIVQVGCGRGLVEKWRGTGSVQLNRNRLIF